MPFFEQDDLRLHYSVTGPEGGLPVLLIAPGGMKSEGTLWGRMPWNPIAGLSDRFRVVAMDQRNAGQSVGPIEADHGWHTYTADQLALMDHLGFDRFFVVGMCIGGPYILGLTRAAPERVIATVMFQPIGLDANREAFESLFDSWRAGIEAAHPEADAERWDGFRKRMFGGDFLFNTSREQAASCHTPTLLFMGSDLYHPESTSRELADLLPNNEFVEQWKTPDVIERTAARVREFLGRW